MDLSVLNMFLAICGVLILSCLVLLFNFFWWVPKKLERALRKQGFHGLPYTPFSGNTKDFFRAKQESESKPMEFSHRIVPRVFLFFDQIVQTYGKTFFFWFGPIPTVNIMDPVLITEILSNKSGHYEKPNLSLIKLISLGLVNLEGEKWAKHRRIINPAFHVEKLRGMLPAFSASCSELVDKWEQRISSNEFYEVDVWPEMQALTGDVISRTAFGSNYEEGKQIFQLITELVDICMKIYQRLYIPGYKYLPTKENLRRREINREVRTILEHMIEEREKAMKGGEVTKNDLLGLLMESNYKESQQEGVGMTMEEVIEECKLFYFAGQETTASLLTWTVVVLAMHPSWQERAREEVLQVFQKNKPEFDGLNQLKIVTMILYEVLRLYAPVTGFLRCNCKKLQLREITLPAGIQLFLPVLLMHHDPDLWGEDVQEFKPERFAEGVSKATKNRASFTPFGFGPRICIGQSFAMTEAKIAMAMILQHFTFELSPSYAHAPHTIAILRPQHGAQIILHKL